MLQFPRPRPTREPNWRSKKILSSERVTKSSLSQARGSIPIYCILRINNNDDGNLDINFSIPFPSNDLVTKDLHREKGKTGGKPLITRDILYNIVALSSTVAHMARMSQGETGGLVEAS